MASFNRISPPKKGEQVASCEFIEQFLEKGDHGQTFWRLKCECGFVFERRAAEQKNAHKKGQKKLYRNIHLHRDIKVGQRFNRLTIVNFVKKKKGKD